MKNTKILSNTSNIKAFLMLTVVLYHSCIFWAGIDWCGCLSEAPKYCYPLYIIYKYLKDAHVYCFTLISGFIFYYTKIQYSKYSSFKELLSKKTKRLIVPYLYTSIFWIIPFDILIRHLTAHELITKYVLGYSPSQLWFLLMLFFVFVIFYSLYNIINKSWLYGLFISTTLYIFANFIPYNHNCFQIYTACSYFSYFWIGYELAKHPQILNALGIKSNLIVFLSYILLIQSDYDYWILVFMRRILGALLLLLITYRLSDSKIFFSKYFQYFSKNSLKVFLLHQQTIYLIIYNFNDKIHPIVDAIFCFTLSVTISLSIIYTIDKIKQLYEHTLFST